MRRMTLVTSTFIVACLAITAAAQSTPSFAGKWGLTSGSALGHGKEFTVSQDNSTLTIVSALSTSKDVFNFDGSESTNTARIGREEIPKRSTLKRDGARLILTTAYHSQGFDVRLTETWTLEPSGQLTIEYDYVQGSERTSHKSTYKKS